ncbi:MAG: hypothetical protein IJU20_02355 [Clostridia bacterium]|nr:hypothetical protein [Clostridia bacterium]
MNQERQTTAPFFRQAKAVWAKGGENRNRLIRYTAEIPGGEKASLSMCAADLFRVFQNGRLISCGPARAAYGFARVLRIPLDRAGGRICVDVLSYGINQYACVEQEPFFAAEIEIDGRVQVYTGDPEGGWSAFWMRQRVQKTQRYSYQRGFSEYWNDQGKKEEPVITVPAHLPDLLPTETLPPTLRFLAAARVSSEGKVSLSEQPLYVYTDRSLLGISPGIKGYSKEELEVCLTDEVGKMAFVRQKTQDGTELYAGEFRTFALPGNRTGLVSFVAVCPVRTTVYVLMDELLREGDVDPFRMGDVCNIARFDLEPGTTRVLTMETFTTQGLKMVVTQGQARISEAGLVEVESSAWIRPMPEGMKNDPELVRIWDAAVETFRQNALDIFMDCPSRERAGWLCDSFFAARAERCLTGESRVEKAFLENYLLYRGESPLPPGMLPMCYPAAHPNSVYIPNWAMWLVLQIGEYAQRSGDAELIAAFRPRLDALIAFLDTFLNEDGLLEHLGSWVFVEWSRANEWVQDVHYPSNMLYAKVLETYGRLYGEPGYPERAERMRRTITAQSFDGTYFRDHALRDAEGRLKVAQDKSEVCQYFAFFTGLVSPRTAPDLWNLLQTRFGPGREALHPDVAKANTFVGDYLRLELLFRYGCREALLADIKGYFASMSEQTGTLWENDTPHASLCHGFTAHVVCWLCAVFDRPD